MSDVTLMDYIDKDNDDLVSKIESITSYKLTPFQKKAIEAIDKTSKNLLVIAPTGAGKSVIGYSALLKHKGYYLAPLIALMNEKFYDINNVFKSLGYSVIMTNKEYRIPFSVIKNADIKIMSPYKFLTYINYMPKANNQAIVIDEFHKLSKDPEFEASIILAKKKGYRIIGLSATISENDEKTLAEWLNADIIKETKRPVELKHYPISIVQNGGLGVILKSSIKIDDKLIMLEGERFKSANEFVAHLASKIYINTKKPVIVWAPTRRQVATLASKISELLPVDSNYAQIASKIPKTKGAENTLKDTVLHGVWIHHGGLSTSTRRLVEDNYKKMGGIIVTAYTLSHGVNIPGTFLIFSTLYDYKNDILDASTFHQISGRAGRPGFDDIGIVLTVVQGKAELSYYNKIVNQGATKIEPTLLSDRHAPLRLGLVVYSTTKNVDDVLYILKESYQYFTTHNDKAVEDIITRLNNTLNIYSKEPKELADVAMSMGLLPEEYTIIKEIINSSDYSTAITKVIDEVCKLYDINPQNVKDELLQFGFMATITGKLKSREVASNIQNLLETGAFFAGRVYGYKSKEYEKMTNFAKEFAYANNPYVEELANSIAVDTLRRMIRAVPQIITGSTPDEASQLIGYAMKEAFLYNKKIYRDRLEKMIRLTYRAITKKEEASIEEYQNALKEVVNLLKTELGIEILG